jgi:hypothetical protein
MNEGRLLRIRIESLKEWRKEICEEFGKWPTHYTMEWFFDQLKQIDTLVNKLESPKPSYLTSKQVK